MKIFNITFLPKYSDDLVLPDERRISESIDKIMATAYIISSNLTGRTHVEIWENGNLVDEKIVDVHGSVEKIKAYLESFK